MSTVNFGGGGNNNSSSSNTPASSGAAPAALGGFNLGGGGGSSSSNAPAPAATGAAPTFGAAPGGSNAPATTTTATAVGFGGASSASNTTPAPAPTGTTFGFTGTSSTSTTTAPPFGASSSTGGTQQQQQQGPPLVQESDYESRFPGLQIWRTLGPLINDDNHVVLRSDSLRGQELMHALRLEDSNSIAHRLLSAIQLEPACTPNQTIRQQLSTQMLVQLHNKQEAPLQPNQLQEILEIADDLRVSEPDAIALYHYASQRPPELQFAGTEMNMIMACRHLYALNKEKLWQSWVMLWLARVQAAASPEHAAVILGTDGLLQPAISKLIPFIRETSTRIQETINRLAHLENQTTTSNDAFRKEMDSWARYLQQIIKDRQFAAECLFFIAYQTQLTVDEVSNLVDLIQDLTDGTDITKGLVQLDPYTDVPDAYEPVDAQAMAFYQQHPAFMAPPQRREKDRLVWQRELVGTVWNMGQPQLLRCVSTLVMSVLCALDTKNVLLNRETHGPNSFGMGNALVPSEYTSTDSLLPLHQRLGKDAEKNWKRADILGVLMASYAMLLRSCPSALMSPRAGPVASPGRIDVRKAWRECIDAPTELKSFSFARLSLLPALQMPSHAFETKFDISEFLLSVLSEFAANYLEAVSASGNRPISRAKWEQDAESQLKYKRETAEQQRAFNQWSGTSDGNQEVVPDSVDLLARPDCMDDVFAFASAVCSLGPEYALSFWSKEESSSDHGAASKLIPSRALRDLKEQQSSDDTLRQSYLSFLSVLALAKSADGSLDGAKAIYEMMAEEEQASNTRGAVTWPLLFQTIRYYARELSYQNYGSASSAASTSGTSNGSTAYYYFASDSPATTQTTTKESTPRNKRELGEESTFSLLAHLNLICNVASKSALARTFILSVHLPIESPDGREVVGQDSALMILFNLSVAALAPDVRGKVFETAAALLKLDGTTKEQSLQIRQSALKGWELLEAYLVLPIHLLEQYSSVQLTDIQNVPGLAFPPSSTSLVSSKANKSWLPADPHFSIIYEMEHVESALGVYKSTGGFLSLLKSLVTAGGCPSRLGSNWRVRAGCTPYIEYVIDLVIPRATGKFGNYPALPFRTDQDKNLLVGLALELVETVVSNYLVPSPDMKGKSLNECYKKSLAFAKLKLGHEGLAGAVVTEPSFPEERDCYPDLGAIDVTKTTDYSSHFAPDSTLTPTAFANNFNAISRVGDVPAGMSPGVTVLAGVLSSESTLLDSLLEALRSAVIVTKDCIESDSFALAQSLYVSTQPSFSSAKKASRSSSIESLPRQTTLEALQPVPSTPTYTKSIELKKRSILSVLRILCAVVVREEACTLTLKQASTRMTLVPFLRFQAKIHTASQLKVLVLNFAQLSDQIVNVDTQTSVISQLIDCASFRTFQSANIASAAASLIFNVGEELGPQKGLHVLCRRHNARSYRLARAFGDTLLRCSVYYSSGPALDLTKLILEKILAELRNPSRYGDSFVLAMLGLPSETFERGLWHIGSPQGDSPRDCFETILRLLHKDEFVFPQMKPEVVSLCYEVIYRLSCLESLDSMSLRRVDYISKHLRSLDFWKIHVSSAIPLVAQAQLNDPSDTMHFLHSLAWMLKGLAEEFRLLASAASPQPETFESLFRVLVDPDRNQQLVSAIPMERVSGAVAVVPPEDSIRCSKYKIKGAPGVVTGYELVDASRLCAHANVQDVDIEAGYRAWADRWNSAVMRDCVASHLTSAIHIAFGSASMAFKEMVPHLPSQAGPWLNMLKCLIGRMSNPMGQQPGISSLDEQFFTTATRNLSLAIVVTADFARFSSDHEANSLLPEVSLSIIRLIALSGNGISDGPLSARQTERTANLASALSILMSGAAPKQFEGFAALQAGVVLSCLAIQKASPSVPFEPPTHLLMSRSCLSLLFRVAAKDDDNFCRSILTQAVGRDKAKLVVDGLISFISLLDPDISSLLSEIAEWHFGGHLLIERGVLEALQEAATVYLSEESKFVSSRSTSVQAVEIGTPSFFQGHLRLLCTLMDSQEKDNAVFDKIRVKFCGVLSIYSPILQRLTEKFPREGNELAFLTRCIAKLHFSTGLAQSHAIVPASTKEMFFNDAFRVAESRIFSIAMHIAENPLPFELQRPLPACLARKEPASTAAVVTVVATPKTWWDALNIDKSVDGKEEIFRLAALGLAMARDGLCSIRRSQQPFTVVDIPSVLRAICRCGDTLKWAEIESSMLLSPSRSADCKTPSHSIALRDKASDLLEDLILLVLSRIRRLKSGPIDRRVTGDLQNLIMSTLNYLGMNTTAFGVAHPLPSDENKPNYTRELADALRIEAESLTGQDGACRM